MNEPDGQAEVLNHCVETYLRCFTFDRPRWWSKWLAWADYCYNTGFQSNAGGTLFAVVYGRPPTTLRQFLLGKIRVQASADELQDRDEILQHLRFQLEKAQQLMVLEANKH